MATIYMRNLLIFIFIFCSQTAIFGQFGGGSKAIRKIKDTELMVILDPAYGDGYNEEIQNAVKKYWTFTKYRFISGPQYKKYCNDPKYSFLSRFEVKEASVVEEKIIFLGIIQGGSCGQAVGDFAAYFNLWVWGEKAYAVECVRTVQILQNYLQLGTDNDIPALKNWEDICRLYNRRKHELNGKQWLLQTADVLEEYQDIRKVRTIYTRGKVRFAEFDEIDDAIKEGNDSTIYHQLCYDSEGYRFHVWFL
ncbi:MAG: hypothetical protein RI894_1910, partial [Bacteroidota bacterium]